MLLLLITFISHGLFSASSECTQGFMDYDLLVQKASQIHNSGGKGTLSDNGLGLSGKNRRYVMPSLNFTCPGVITGLLLGAVVRIDSGRNKYPSIRLHNVDVVNGTTRYSVVSGSSRSIVLGAHNFSTSGVFEYELSRPISYTPNQILGVRQPNTDTSVVRLFYEASSGQDIFRVTREGDGYVKHSSGHIESSRILLHPITDDNCSSGFISSQDIKEKATFITTVDDLYNNTFGTERFYEDIRFTCDGNITHVVIGTRDNSGQTPNPPELRFWRSSNGIYTQSGPTIKLYYNDAAVDISTNYLRWYNLSVPLSVQQGDVLGIYHYQPISEADCVIYYQRYNGPVNYNNSFQTTGYNMYPLVSVVFEILPSTTSLLETTFSEYTTSMSLESTAVPLTSASDSITMSLLRRSGSTSVSTSQTPVSERVSGKGNLTSDGTMMSLLRQSDFTSVSTSQTPVSERVSGNGTPDAILGGAIVSAVFVVLLLVIITTIAVLIWLKRKEKMQAQRKFPSHDLDSLSGLNNIVYQSNAVPINATEPEICLANALYEDNALHIEKPLSVYEPIAHPAKESVESVNADQKEFYSQAQSTGFTNPIYEGSSVQQKESSFNVYELTPQLIEGYASVEVNDANTETVYSVAHVPALSTVSNALYEAHDIDVSTQVYSQGSGTYNTLQFGLCVPNNVQRQQLTHGGNEEEIYGKLIDSQYAFLEKTQESFFAEEAIYWQPEGNTKNIYEQLAKKRYREIPQHQIRIISHLGSGQFGTVDKGVWNTLKGPVEVAVKTLKSKATEDEEAKFLQEAAINGQFHHLNVITLCGVVTVGHPIMIILEYMPHGDLKTFLKGIRPVPGELPDDSLAISLSKFSHQVVSGMVYLSRKRFVHRDLAARNILVGDKNICKIADFGMSRDLQNENYYMSNSKKIPVKWTAPEALHFRKYSTQSDVWSFGAVLYEIWSVGHKPFEESTNQECVHLVDSGYRLPPPPGCPRIIYEMMIQCWHPSASSRPTFDYLESHLRDTESIASQAGNLGIELINGHSLYPDIQKMYQ